MYRDVTGSTSIAAARQAVQDFGQRGFNVEIIFADHQNRPDVGVNIARQWFDRDGVDCLADVATSSVALAANDICREKNKVHINSSAATSDLTGVRCSPNMVHWTYDTWMLAISVGGATVRAGGDAWFFITADYAFGQGTIRPDGRKIHPSFLFEVKKPEESRGPWDYYKLLQMTEADKAFRPLAEGGCNLVRSEGSAKPRLARGFMSGRRRHSHEWSGR